MYNMRHPSYYQSQGVQSERGASSEPMQPPAVNQAPAASDVAVEVDRPIGWLARNCPAVRGNVQLRITDNVVVKLPADMVWSHIITVEPTYGSYKAKVQVVNELPEFNVVDIRPNPCQIVRATCCQRFLDCLSGIGTLCKKSAAGVYRASICHQSFVLVAAMACLLTHITTAIVSSAHRDLNWYIVLIYNLGFVAIMMLMSTAYLRVRENSNITPVVFMAWVCKAMQVLQVASIVFPPELGDYSRIIYNVLLIFDIVVLEILTMHGTTLLGRLV